MTSWLISFEIELERIGFNSYRDVVRSMSVVFSVIFSSTILLMRCSAVFGHATLLWLCVALWVKSEEKFSVALITKKNSIQTEIVSFGSKNLSLNTETSWFMENNFELWNPSYESWTLNDTNMPPSYMNTRTKWHVSIRMNQHYTTKWILCSFGDSSFEFLLSPFEVYNTHITEIFK